MPNAGRCRRPAWGERPAICGCGRLRVGANLDSPAQPKVSLGYLNRDDCRDALGDSDLSEFPTKLMPSM